MIHIADKDKDTEFTVIETVCNKEGDPELSVTTNYHLALGWTTQIHGGPRSGKIWVAMTRNRAAYYHRVAVALILVDKRNARVLEIQE